MGSSFTLLVGYAREGQNLRDPDRIRRTLEAFTRLGYWLGDFNEDLVPPNPGISPTTSQAIEAFLAGEAVPFEGLMENSLSISGISLLPAGALSFFEFVFTVEAEDNDESHEGRIMLYVDDQYFTFDGGGVYSQADRHARYEHLLDLSQLIYSLWQPIFLYDPSSVGFDTRADTSRSDALALQPRHLYDLNLYSPEIVTHLGRDRLLSAPAWRVSSLEDGGILLVPREVYPSSFGPGGYPDRSFDRAAVVAAHIGLPYWNWT